MTTVPDMGLECDLLKKAIREYENMHELKIFIAEWLEKRIELKDPGFSQMGDCGEKLLNDLHVLFFEQDAATTKMDYALRELPTKTHETEKVYDTMLNKLNSSTANPVEVALKKTALEEWCADKIGSLKHSAQVLRDQVGDIKKKVHSALDALIKHVRLEEDMAQPQGDGIMMNEVENLLDTVHLDESEKEFLRAPTLVLGEYIPSPPCQAPDEAQAEVPVETPPMMLPDNQLGDESLFPSTGNDTAVESPKESVTPKPKQVVKRLIVPDGHDKPIKQTKVNIFAPSVAKQPAPGEDVKPTEVGVGGDGDKTTEGEGGIGSKMEDVDPDADNTLRSPTCEEQAMKHIEKLEEGPTKKALLSLCEAAVAKVGLFTLHST